MASHGRGTKFCTVQRGGGVEFRAESISLGTFFGEGKFHRPCKSQSLDCIVYTLHCAPTVSLLRAYPTPTARVLCTYHTPLVRQPRVYYAPTPRPLRANYASPARL